MNDGMHLELYRRFTEARPEFDTVGKIMPYEWTKLPDPLEAIWMAYSFMLDDFARELANAMNGFTLNVRRLCTWESLMASLDEKEQAEALHEFIEPIVTLCLLTPYMIKSRLLFATAHLCHQVNLQREAGWPEGLLPVDDAIWMGSADQQGAPWRRYTRLKTRIEAIGGNKLRKATADFRNAFTHRFSPRVGTGITNFVTRNLDPATGRVVYAFGGTDPLELKDVSAQLVAELAKGYAAFAALQALVEDQETYVAAENVAARAVREK